MTVSVVDEDDDETPDVSVVVATHNRATLLPDLFAALESQSFDGRFEVVVTDDGSSDDTTACLERLASAVSFDVALHRHDVAQGPAGARNTALGSARAELIAFTDDDCRPEPGWLEAGVAAMRSDWRVVVGHVRPPTDRRVEPNERRLLVTTWRRFETANVFYRRADLDAVGGFFTGFHGPGGEDLDLGMRVTALGAAPHYEPAAVVIHPLRTLDTRGALREAARWTGVTLVMQRHPELRTELLHRPWLWRKAHLWFLLGAASTLAGRGHPLSLLGWMPWIRRKFGDHGYRATTVKFLPQLAAVDAVEIATLARTSLRDRTFIL